MPINRSDLDARIKASLQEGKTAAALPPEMEASLLRNAERLLSPRRERVVERKSKERAAQVNQRRRVASFRKGLSWTIELLALHPDTSAAAAMAATLVLAFFAIHASHSPVALLKSSRLELGDFPRFNDAPARYDAQRIAEQQAYEREVEDAHQKTSGGI